MRGPARFAAFLLAATAALGSFGWFFELELRTVAGLTAAAIAAVAAAGFPRAELVDHRHTVDSDAILEAIRQTPRLTLQPAASLDEYERAIVSAGWGQEPVP